MLSVAAFAAQRGRYRKQKAEAAGQLVALPDNNKLVMFDKHRALASSLPDAIAAQRRTKLGVGGAAR